VRTPLLGAVVESGPVDVRVDRPLLSARLGDGGLVADRSRALVELPDVAVFGIEDGRRVVVDAAKDVSTDVLDAWLGGLVAAIVLAQRGSFALHANLVDVGGAAVAVAGARGAGKTTTSLVLERRGARLLADDVLSLESAGGAVTYRTTGRPLRVTPEIAAALEVEVARAGPAEAGAKLLLPRRPAPPGELRGIVVLAETAVSGVERERLAGAHAAQAVLANLYRFRLLRPIWRRECFAWAAAVAAAVAVHAVRRPSGRWSGEGVAAAVEAVAAEGRRE
jgi:hypothetical protein